MKSNIKQFDIVLIVLSIIGFSLIWIRAEFGVEVTDEAYWVAEPYLIYNGAVPYVDNWSQTPLTCLLIAPVISLYLFFAHSTEGLFLFMCRATVVFRAIVAFLVWILLKKRIDKTASAVCALLFFLVDVGHSRVLNYNLIAMYLLGLAGVVLYNAANEEIIKKTCVYYFLAGLIMAICALAHVAQIVNCITFAIIIFTLDHRKVKRLPVIFVYIIGGLIVGVITVLYLEAKSGGGVFKGLYTTLIENNYYAIDRLPLINQLKTVIHSMLYYYFRLSILTVLIGWCLYLLFNRVHINLKINKSKLIKQAFSIALIVYFFKNFLFPGDADSSDQVIFILFFAYPVYFLFSIKDYKKYLYQFVFLWLPSLITIVILGVSSHSAVSNRYYLLFMGALLSIINVFEDYLRHTIIDTEYKMLFSVVPGALAVAFALALIINTYTNAYREAPPYLQTYTIEKGVYKGCRTTYDRAKAIEKFESEIKLYLNSDDNVLFADLMPTAYLMTESHPFTPTTWDVNHYRYGFEDNDLLSIWFKLKGEIPDKIVFVNSEERPLSIDDELNEFGRFVNGNYELMHKSDEGLFSFRVYARPNY